jgi:hypothetical protein
LRAAAPQSKGGWELPPPLAESCSFYDRCFAFACPFIAQRTACRAMASLVLWPTETWFPRCGAADTPNGIESRHGPAGLTADPKTLQEHWEEQLDKNQVLDFATVQKRFLRVQPALHDKLRHVFVDEFQDNNPIQFTIHTGWLANPRMRLTVVGDDDQALHRFRGSDLACFADLGPHCARRNVPYRQEKLEENYRSTRAVVDFSQA